MGQELTGAALHLARVRADLAKARAAAAAMLEPGADLAGLACEVRLAHLAAASELNALEAILMARELVDGAAEAGQQRAGVSPALLASLHRAGDHTLDPNEEGITA